MFMQYRIEVGQKSGGNPDGKHKLDAPDVVRIKTLKYHIQTLMPGKAVTVETIKSKAV